MLAVAVSLRYEFRRGEIMSTQTSNIAFYHTLLTLLAIPSDVGDEGEHSRWSCIGREVGGRGARLTPEVG